MGRSVRGPGGDAVAALSIAMPTMRFTRSRVPEWSAALHLAGARIETDLAAAGSAAHHA